MRHDGRNDGPDAQAGDPKPETLLDRQLDALFEQLEIEKAPPSLTRRLQRIPQEQQAGQAWWRRLLLPVHAPRWVLVPAAAAALIVIGVFLVHPREPSQEEILRARQELAVAFGYIDKAGMLAGREIQSVLGGELRDDLRDPVKENLSKHIPFTEQSRKEETT
jgi:hypothetical protein